MCCTSAVSTTSVTMTISGLLPHKLWWKCQFMSQLWPHLWPNYCCIHKHYCGSSNNLVIIFHNNVYICSCCWGRYLRQLLEGQIWPSHCLKHAYIVSSACSMIANSTKQHAASSGCDTDAVCVAGVARKALAATISPDAQVVGIANHALQHAGSSYTQNLIPNRVHAQQMHPTAWLHLKASLTGR